MTLVPVDKTSMGHHLLSFPVVSDIRGKLSVIEDGTGLPFHVQRVYYLYDVPENSRRGGHAHLQLQQLLIAISGAFSVEATSTDSSYCYRLADPTQALYIGPGTWRELHSFTANAVCLVLASRQYEESDYIRSWDEFKNLLAGHK